MVQTFLKMEKALSLRSFLRGRESHRGISVGMRAACFEPTMVIRSSDIRSGGGSLFDNPSAQEVVARTGGRESYLRVSISCGDKNFVLIAWSRSQDIAAPAAARIYSKSGTKYFVQRDSRRKRPFRSQQPSKHQSVLHHLRESTLYDAAAPSNLVSSYHLMITVSPFHRFAYHLCPSSRVSTGCVSSSSQ